MRTIRRENTRISMQYQPSVKSSSNLSRLRTARVRHHKNSIIPDAMTYSPNSRHRNSENITSEKYSDSMMIEKYSDENSVMNPATSSLSASGKSKGTLLLSTSTHTLNITNNTTLNSTADRTTT